MIKRLLYCLLIPLFTVTLAFEIMLYGGIWVITGKEFRHDMLLLIRLFNGEILDI